MSIQVTSVKCRFDQWESSSPTDAHVPAALLKQWLRELYIPLIPDAASYDDAIAVGDDVELAVSLVMKLPELHRVILTYLIRWHFVHTGKVSIHDNKSDQSIIHVERRLWSGSCKCSLPKKSSQSQRWMRPTSPWSLHQTSCAVLPRYIDTPFCWTRKSSRQLISGSTDDNGEHAERDGICENPDRWSRYCRDGGRSIMPCEVLTQVLGTNGIWGPVGETFIAIPSQL